MIAIETEFRGVKFRSRTETRWAMVFDALGIEWLYEPEGFELPDVGRYVPDFYLPGIGCWFEVKGEKPTKEEQAKCAALAAASKKRVMLAYGYVSPSLARVYDSEAGMIWCFVPNEDGAGVDYPFALCRCPKCGRYGIEFDGRSARIRCGCQKTSDKDYSAGHPDIVAAYERAERHRFWDPPAKHA